MPAEPIEPAAEIVGEGNIVYADEAARALLAGEQGRLFCPRSSGWKQVKHNASRTVLRGRIGEQEVYLKQFHNPSGLHRAIRRFGHSGAMREMRFSRHLAARGVPTAPALAAYCHDEAEWLLTKAVTDARPADQWHDEQLRRGEPGRRLIQRAIVRLARMIARLHAAGVVHRDLHCGNVLVRTDPADADDVRLVLMDLHRAHRRRKLSRRAAAANLAQLFYDRYYVTTRTERLRFLRHYLRTSGTAGSLRGWQLLIEHFAQMHTRRQHRQRDRRVFRHGKYFTRLKLPDHWRAHVVLASKRHMAGSRAAEHDLHADDWRRALQEPESLLSGKDVRVIKSSQSGLVVRRTLHVGPHALDVFIKCPRRKRRWKVLADCFRLSRPVRNFALGHALLTRRIATALPLAALERRVGPILHETLLITEAVGAPRLNDFLNTWLAFPPRGDTPLSVPEQRHLAQEVLWQLGRLLQRLHDSRFAHRDLKATNILVRWSPGTSPEIVLVDLDGLTHRRFLTARRRFQGLMRLNVSLLKCPAVNRAGRLRMLMGYLRRLASGRVAFKPYWRVLEAWSAKKLRQQIRSRRKRQKAARRPAT